MQLGRIERKYAALDIGPVAVFELTLLPRSWQDLPTIFEKGALTGGPSADMTLSDASFPTSILRLSPEEEEASNSNGEADPAGAGAFESMRGRSKTTPSGVTSKAASAACGRRSMP